MKIVKDSQVDKNILSYNKSIGEKQNLRDYNSPKEKAMSPKQSSNPKKESFNAPLKQMTEPRGDSQRALLERALGNKSTHSPKVIRNQDPAHMQEESKISAIQDQGNQ